MLDRSAISNALESVMERLTFREYVFTFHMQLPVNPRVDWLCFALLFFGALMWGLLGIFETNVIESTLNSIFQESIADTMARIIYVMIGLAGIYFVYPLFRLWQSNSQ